MTLSQKILDQSLQRPIQYFPSVDSTNLVAQNWLRNGADAGSVVIADEQTKGRGRRGRSWYNPPGVSLSVTIILKPEPQNASQLSMVGALAVYDLCAYAKLSDTGIKWPNDVQVKGKKISGVLPEAVWDGSQLLGVVLGMGVNVRNQFDDQLARIATSIEAEAGRTFERLELIPLLLERTDYWAARIGSDELVRTWKSHLNTLGQSVVVEGINQRIVGQAVDVERNGTLLIKTADGSIQAVMAGDVSLRPQDKG